MKTRYLFTSILLLFLFFKPVFKANTLSIQRDTTVVDTLNSSTKGSIMDIKDPETASALKSIKTKSIVIIIMAALIFPILLYTFFFETEVLIIAVPVLLIASIIGSLSLRVKTRWLRNAFSLMDSSDRNYERIRKIITLSKWAIVAPILPFLLFLMFVTTVPGELDSNDPINIVIFGVITALVYAIFEWTTFGTNHIFDK